MDERLDNPLSPHEQFIASMEAVENAQPNYGIGIARAIAKAIKQEEAGDAPAMIGDPADMITDDEVEMGHSMAALQGIDLSPFGLIHPHFSNPLPKHQAAGLVQLFKS